MTDSSRYSLTPALDAQQQVLDTAAAGALSYYVDRSQSGRPLLLLHSMNAAPSAMEIRPLFDHYRGQRPVYAPDLPGYGYSERRDIEYTPALYANSLRELLEKDIGEPADIVALSTSCEFAARAALESPRFVNSLALISPTGLGSRQPPAPETGERLHRVFSLPVLGASLYKVLTTRPSIRYFLNMAFEDRAPVELIDYAYATSHQPGAQYAPFCFLSMKMFTRDALAKLYQKLVLPTLVIYDRDPNINFDRLPILLEKNSAVESVRISPTQGLPHWERPAETFAALDSFWRKHQQAEAAA